MPLPKALLEELERKHLHDAAAAARETRRDLTRTAFACVGWCVAGLGLFALAFHTSNPPLGHALLIAGQVVAYSGIVLTLARAYLRGERRGDW